MCIEDLCHGVSITPLIPSHHTQVAAALRSGEREMGRLEGKVKALQSAIIDVGGPKLKAAQAAVKSAMGAWGCG